MDPGGDPGYENQSPIRLVGDECPGAVLELSTNEPDDICVKPGEPVTVTLSQSCIPGLVRGYQAFLSFNTSALSFDSGSYTSEPFGLPVIDPIAAVLGEIDLAAGIDDPGGQQPTSTSADLVTLNFLAGTTEGPTQVVFRTHDPPTRFSDEVGDPVVPVLVNSPMILVDGTPPVITCPVDVEVNADAGACVQATGVDPGWATATDALDPNPPTIEYKRSDYANWNEGRLDPYPQGTTTITWRATDCAGNYVECTQTIQVNAYNELVVDVELQWSFTGTRCITFELWDCGPDTSQTVAQVLNFTNGWATGELVLVPCGVYDCITARDTLHTLRRTDDGGDFTVSGTQYVADFTSTGFTDDSLVGGNLNDDFWIDILDFGVFSWQWGEVYPGSGDTTCTTTPPHADIDGNGVVQTADFVFISDNFLMSHEANCCGAPLRGGEGGDGPITEISVPELYKRGLGHLSVGDLNGDAWVDEADIVAFMQGARPKPQLQPQPDQTGPALLEVEEDEEVEEAPSFNRIRR